jgi:hypothetical protein
LKEELEQRCEEDDLKCWSTHEQEGKHHQEGRVDRDATASHLSASYGKQMIVETAAEQVVGQQYRLVLQLVHELDVGTSSPTSLPYKCAIGKK